MLITKKNFKYQKKYAYYGDDKYPRYILCGKKINKELAEKIIITETETGFLEYNNDIKNYENDSIKKPLSIRESIEEEEREKYINGMSDENIDEKDDNSDNDDVLSVFYNQEFVTNTSLTEFVDACGNVGAIGNTLKYPFPFELLFEHLEYSNRYPFLEYVIIYAEYDGYLFENHLDSLLDIHPPLLIDTNHMFEAFSYALYVHDGGVEVVNKDEAIKLYKKYQKGYTNNLIFDRRDYDEYVKNFIFSLDN